MVKPGLILPSERTNGICSLTNDGFGGYDDNGNLVLGNNGGQGWGDSGCNGLSVFWLANIANFFSGNHAGFCFLRYVDISSDYLSQITDFNIAFQLVAILVSGHLLTQRIQITNILLSQLTRSLDGANGAITRSDMKLCKILLPINYRTS